MPADVDVDVDVEDGDDGDVNVSAACAGAMGGDTKAAEVGRRDEASDAAALIVKEDLIVAIVQFGT